MVCVVEGERGGGGDERERQEGEREREIGFGGRKALSSSHKYTQIKKHTDKHKHTCTHTSTHKYNLDEHSQCQAVEREVTLPLFYSQSPPSPNVLRY